MAISFKASILNNCLLAIDKIHIYGKYGTEIFYA